MDAATTFPKFARLPPELRRMIWASTLPAEEDPPGLCFCDWRVYIGSNRPASDSQAEEAPAECEEEVKQWVPQYPVYVQVASPEVDIVFVNREARAVLGEWTWRHCYSKQYRDETQGLVFTRLWTPEHDVLYVPRTEWEEFYDMLTESDDDEPNIGQSIRNLALPAFTVYYSTSAICILMESMPNLKRIYAIWDKLPEPRSSGRTQGMGKRTVWRCSVQPRWELQSAWHSEELLDDDDLTMNNSSSGEVCLVATDPVDGRAIGHDIDDLEVWAQEIDEQFKNSEVPDHAWDEEKGELKIDVRHVKAVMM